MVANINKKNKEYKIKLKKNWNIYIKPPLHFLDNSDSDDSFTFSGRKREVEKIKNDILNRDMGSIAICGYNGVGKSALIYKVLNDIIKESNKQKKNGDNSSNHKGNEFKPLTVLINAPELFLSKYEDGKKIKPREVIINLIKNLYLNTSHNQDLKKLAKNEKEIYENINLLYRKAMASIFKESFSNEASSQTSQEYSLNINNNNFKDFYVNLLIPLIPPIAILYIQEVPIYLKIIISILMIISILSFNYNIKKSNSRKKHYEETFQFDNNINILLFDLKNIHYKLLNNHIKLIYIIDELDKIENKEIIEILKIFKSLFLHSNAIFIFIGNESLYNLPDVVSKEEANTKGYSRTGSGVDLYRSKEYTYFSSKYLIPRARYQDLDEFFNNIIDKKFLKKIMDSPMKTNGNIENGDIDQTELRNIKEFLFFEAKNDFFDLKNIINQYIQYQDGDPYLILRLDSEKIEKATFYHLYKIISDKYLSDFSEDWALNELLQNTLFDYIHQIYYCSNPNQIFKDNSIYDKDHQKDIYKNYAEKMNREIKFEMIRTFNKLLLDLDILSIKGTKPIKTPWGYSLDIRSYSKSFNIPLDVPEHLSTLLDYEQKFIELFEYSISFLLFTQNLIDQNNSWNQKVDLKKIKNLHKEDFNKLSFFNIFSDILKNFSVCKEAYISLMEKRRKTRYTRPEINKFTEMVRTSINQVENNFTEYLGFIYPYLIQQKKEDKIILNNDINSIQSYDFESIRYLNIWPNSTIIHYQNSKKNIIITSFNIDEIERKFLTKYKDMKRKKSNIDPISTLIVLVVNEDKKENRNNSQNNSKISNKNNNMRQNLNYVINNLKTQNKNFDWLYIIPQLKFFKYDDFSIFNNNLKELFLRIEEFFEERSQGKIYWKDLILLKRIKNLLSRGDDNSTELKIDKKIKYGHIIEFSIIKEKESENNLEVNKILEMTKYIRIFDNLKKIILNNNRFSKKLTQEAINNILSNNSLREISLNNNDLSDVQFRHNLLETIDLSYNEFKNISFLNLLQVKEINLSHNKIKILSSNNNIGTLKSFNLSNNQITKIEPEFFHGIQKLEKLNLSNNKIKEIPENIKLKKLKKLDLSQNEIIKIPLSLFSSLKLEELNLCNNNIEEIPENIKLKKLKKLDLSQNEIIKIPLSLFSSLKLEILNLSNNKIEEIPENINKLSQLKKLDLSFNLIIKISRTLFSSLKLEELNLSNNKIEEIPKNINRLFQLKKLNLSSNLIKKIFPTLFNAQGLEVLNLSNNNIEEIPENIKLKKLKKLDLSQNEIIKIPPMLFSSLKLEELNLSNNKIEEIPDITIWRQSTLPPLNIKIIPRTLKKLNLSNNRIKKISPKFFITHQLLNELNLSNNNIEEIPENINNLERLKKLNLSNNGIKNISTSLLNKMKQLEVLNLSNNEIEEIPENINNLARLIKLNLANNKLKSLPQLNKLINLKELDISGNNISNIKEYVKSLREHRSSKIKIIYEHKERN